jgi:RNA-directed DNA polymerase
MKIEKQHKAYIQTAFAEMEFREDFLEILNYVKPLIYGENAILFKLQQITYYASPKRSQKAYKEFQIKKKSGGTRTICAPENGLKAIQKTLAIVLQCVFEPHEAAKGFVMVWLIIYAYIKNYLWKI